MTLYHHFADPHAKMPATPKAPGAKASPLHSRNTQREKEFWIACLFTSTGYGKTTDPASSILQATERAIQDLTRQINAGKIDRRKDIPSPKNSSDAAIDKDGEENSNATPDINALTTAIHGKEIAGEMRSIYSVRINSGLFGVPWRNTKNVLKKGDIDIVVVRRKGEGSDDEEHSGSTSSSSEEAAKHEKGERMQESSINRVEKSTTDKADGNESKPKPARSKSTMKKHAADSATAVEKGTKGVKRKNLDVVDAEKGTSKRQGRGRQTKLRFG
ncbi:MAG: hypothetical protein Q9186_005321 [Xanthomendoza sp. 1 TL-2023]